MILGILLLRKKEILFEITGTLSAHLFAQVYVDPLTESFRNLLAIYLKDCKYLLKYLTHPLVYETLIFLIRQFSRNTSNPASYCANHSHINEGTHFESNYHQYQRYKWSLRKTFFIAILFCSDVERSVIRGVKIYIP